MLPSFGATAAPKAFRTGTHRTASPAETIARAAPFLAAFGITRVANLTGLDRIGVPVVMVCRPNSRSSAVFQGKGLDLLAAKASGIMEAIETWHAEHLQLPLRLGSLNEMRQAYGVAEIGGLALTTATRFHPDLQILWVEGRDLIGGGCVWVPHETVHMDATLREAPGDGCFAVSTNGLASGNHIWEATSHGLCEVIERDAVTLWRRRPPSAQDGMRLDLTTVQDVACRAVLDRLDDAALRVAVWDVTTEVGVAAFQCLVAEASGQMGHVGQGAGCHPTAEIALLRALTEAVQVRTTYIVGAREDIYRSDYHASTLEHRNRSAHALMRRVEPMRDFASVPSQHFADFGAEVAWLVTRLQGIGISQVIAVDLTRREFDLPVVRVIVPGLEGSDHLPGYTPGARARVLAQGDR